VFKKPLTMQIELRILSFKLFLFRGEKMSQFKKGLFLLGLAVIVAGVGCSHVPYAREVKKKPSDSGIIALHTNPTPEDRAKADSIMQMNCAGKEVKVTEEGEVTVGTKTLSSGSSAMGNPNENGFLTLGSGPAVNTYGNSETSAVKEWQISYECIGSKVDKQKKG
jgi:hypothetical protein